jgi:uncharacterized membrane protein
MIYKIQGSRLKLNLISTLIVYIIICFQIYYFIFLNKATLMQSFLLGSSTYGIYEFTNMSIFKGWDYKMAILDTLWGGLLYYLTTWIIRLT